MAKWEGIENLDKCQMASKRTHNSAYRGQRIFYCSFQLPRRQKQGLRWRPFFNSAGLFLKEWIERFNPDKEFLSSAPMWIRLYLLPLEYWEEESLKAIGNVLGDFVKVAEETKTHRYTSYMRICIYMDLKQAFPDTVSPSHEDVEWIQLIDYEHVPFRCRKCHDLGHLFRDCPLNSKPSGQSTQENPAPDGFTKVVNRRRGNKKSMNSTKMTPADLSKP